MKILFGVFDWGLGHATRDKPLINELIKNKHEVHILSTGRPLKVLESWFKEKCKYHEVPSLYHIYSRKGSFKAGFILTLPKITKSLRKARKHTEEIIKKENFDIVISDCRYDVYDKTDNSYLINHQLRFKAPKGVQRILEIWLAKKMKKYKYILVPDYEKENLTGELSHNLKYVPKEKIKYLGILSHIKKINIKQNIDYFISLSGPEHTRIELEKKIISQIKELKGNIVIACGNPDIEKKDISKNVCCHSFLDSKQQEKMMNRAKFIVIRAGYTTIMELVELEKRALLIPSPGQTEQEYLGKYLEKKEYFYHVHQNKLNLLEDIEKAKGLNGFIAPWKTDESIKKFMDLIF